MRVKIRLHGEATGRVLRFDASISYRSLLRTIIDKLQLAGGVGGQIDDGDPTQAFQLRLGGNIVLEDTSDIEHDDEIVLLRIGEDVDGNAERLASTPAAAVGKANHERESTEEEHPEVQEVPIERRPVDDQDVISISSDSDDDSDDDDESLKEEDELNFWEEEEEDTSSSRNAVNQGSDKAKARTQPSKKRKRSPKPPAESPLEVIMDEKDVPSAPGKHEDEYDHTNEAASQDDLEESSLLVSTGARKKKTDRVVKDRIIKLLNTGFHDQSNEHEAKTAMKLAQRLMRKHNLSQALLLKEREATKDRSERGGDEVLKGGMVRVRLVQRKTGKPSLYARWLARLTQPVCDNFEVKAYKQTRRGAKCHVVFYGIYASAQLAGYAYKVAAERIAQMTADYRPATTSGGISTKSSRLSYALGIVEGISKDVQQNLQREKEQQQRKLERARWADARGEAYEESDDEGAAYSFPPQEVASTDIHRDIPDDASSQKNGPDHVGSQQNGGEERGGDSKPTPLSGAELRSRVAELEAEHGAALVLVNHNAKIAEEVLKEHDIKLSSGRRRSAITFDHRSYQRGIEDAKDIDMNQRAIREEARVKTEKQEPR